MAVTIAFALLSFLAVAAALGTLLADRPIDSSLSFVFCMVALGGILGLLGLGFAAVAQLAVAGVLSSLLLLVTWPPQAHRASPLRARYLIAVVPLAVLIVWTLSRFTPGDPTAGPAFVGTAAGSHWSVLGRELVGRYGVVLALLGLLLLASLVSVAYTFQRKDPALDSEEEQ
jgi:NADH:ubiquinone oxidoreductase subunit 6 (subunit J)